MICFFRETDRSEGMAIVNHLGSEYSFRICLFCYSYGKKMVLLSERRLFGKKFHLGTSSTWMSQELSKWLVSGL